MQVKVLLGMTLSGRLSLAVQIIPALVFLAPHTVVLMLNVLTNWLLSFLCRFGAGFNLQTKVKLSAPETNPDLISPSSQRSRFSFGRQGSFHRQGSHHSATATSPERSLTRLLIQNAVYIIHVFNFRRGNVRIKTRTCDLNLLH